MRMFRHEVFSSLSYAGLEIWRNEMHKDGSPQHTHAHRGYFTLDKKVCWANGLKITKE